MITGANDSTKSPSEISTLSSGSCGIYVTETETESLGMDTPVLDDLEPICNVGSSLEDNSANTCNIMETVGAEINTITFNNGSGLITSSGTTVPPTNIINGDSVMITKTKTVKYLHNTKSPQYEPPLTQSVSFDLRAVAKRLKAGQLPRDNDSVGGGRCFRAKITPSSNKDAENELRKEIR